MMPQAQALSNSPTGSHSEAGMSVASTSSPQTSDVEDSTSSGLSPSNMNVIPNGYVVPTKCNLCKSPFNNPKVLHCFHSFCQPCLEKLVDPSDRICCPDCQCLTGLGPNGVSGLIADYAAINNMDQSPCEEMVVNCQGCKSKDSGAVARCFDCQNYLCQNCVTAHQFMHCFEGHRVVDLGDLNNHKPDIRVDKAVRCPRHRSEVLKYFCKTCNMAICKECTLVEHSMNKDHSFEYLNESGVLHVQMLHKLSNSVRQQASALRLSTKTVDHTSKALDQQLKKAENDIDQTFNFFQQMLEDRRKDAVKELQESYQERHQELCRISDQAMTVVEKLVQASDFMDKLLNNASTAEILLSKKDIEVQVEHILSTAPDIADHLSVDLDFMSNFEAIRTAVKNTFGYVRQSTVDTLRMPKPIARPTLGSSVGSQLSPVSSLGLGGLTVPGERATPPTLFDTNHLLSSNLTKHFGGSNNSLNQFATALDTGSYEKWSLGDSSPFSDPSFPMGPDYDPKLMVNPNVYPPKSQIRRQKMIYHCKFGEFGVLEGQFTEPSGVAINAQNDIIVADTNNHRIQIFDREGRFKFQFGECGKRDGQLLYPNRVSVIRPSGDIVVTERSPTHQVQIYNQYGQFVRKFGATVLQHPRGVTVDNKGRIVIVECKVMRVIIFDQFGNVLQKFGCSKYLEFPNGVVVNDKEEIFISDNRAHCVKVFNYQGVFLRQIGGEGLTNYPIGVGINRSGEILIADNHNNFNLTIFNQDGQMVQALESKVKHAQCFDVALLDDGCIVLASKDYRLYVYRYVQIATLGM